MRFANILIALIGCLLCACASQLSRTSAGDVAFLRHAYADFVTGSFTNGPSILALRMEKVDFDAASSVRLSRPQFNKEYLVIAAPFFSGGGAVTVVAERAVTDRSETICFTSESVDSVAETLKLFSESDNPCKLYGID